MGSRDYSESDRIIQMLTAQGRMSVFAHGARKSRRRFQGAFEPFTTIELELERKKRSGLRTVRSTTVIRPRLALRAELEKIALASYVTELASLVAPEDDPSEELYALVEETLEVLMTNPATTVTRRLFELRLLDVLGYAPRLDVCVHCDRHLSAVSFLSFVRGGVFCEEHAENSARIGPKTLAWLGAVYGVEIAPEARSAAFGPEADLEIDEIWQKTAAEKLGPLVSHFYANLLGHPLKSSQLLQSVSI